MKSFVAALWVLDTIHGALVISGAYKYIMAVLVNPLSLNEIPELIIEILFTALVAVPAQGFFVYRIYIFSGESIVPPLIWVPLAAYQLVSTIIYIVKAFYGTNGVRVAELSVLGDTFFMDLAISYLSVAAATDVLIAAFLTVLLVRKRSTPVLSGMGHTLHRLTVFAVNTGIWSATFAVLTLVLLCLYPHNSIYTVFGVPLCSVYCNTVLANLNARTYILGDMTHIDSWRTGGSCTQQEGGETKLIHASEHSEPDRGLMLPDANHNQSTVSAIV
ncbi:hypothetical protein L210DRAFT_2627601 [Boletus edulis BED1]|uniref:DUF6534 domain-containing protein n=1 Tax=Boletus edulis BED1 TaxID=1328754 RepID=A0AAD4GJD8_BOLED|nr:hypothetical protein L210DRAFT_2627601 [Boletus edulis BED1]